MRDKERYSTEDIGTIHFNGGRNMSNMEPTLEIERIKNLIINFDWKITKQKITDEEIVLTIEKPKPTSLKESSAGAS